MTRQVPRDMDDKRMNGNIGAFKTGRWTLLT